MVFALGSETKALIKLCETIVYDANPINLTASRWLKINLNYQ